MGIVPVAAMLIAEFEATFVQVGVVTLLNPDNEVALYQSVAVLGPSENATFQNISIWVNTLGVTFVFSITKVIPTFPPEMPETGVYVVPTLPWAIILLKLNPKIIIKLTYLNVSLIFDVISNCIYNILIFKKEIF